MAHQRDMPACVQRGPGFDLVAAGDVRRGAEAEEDCEDGEADAAHGAGPRQKYAIRRPAQTALSHSRTDTSAETLAPPDASARQSAIRCHGPACAITLLSSAAAISSSLL